MPNPHAHNPPTPEQLRDARTTPRPGFPRGYTQAELAALLLGIDLDTARQITSLTQRIREWEQGRTAPSPAYTRALADALQLDPDDAL